jgi:alpha-1,2-mannosyltransferase
VLTNQAAQTAIDAFFYRKLTIVPWNIVAYNVFGDTSKGPDIYGTESWDFYLRNLVLNFGIWLPIAILALPLVAIKAVAVRNFGSVDSLLRSLTCLAPFYVWITIFTLQPHKEERFMYPVYPFLVLNAASSMHILLQFLGAIPKIPGTLKLFATVSFFTAAIFISLLRTASLATGYTAPLKVYTPLGELANPGDTVCLGKEWYRFPSSYFLPEGVKAKFVKSAFAGLLPGEFDESPWSWEGFPGAYQIPGGMNDENKEDLGKYVSLSSVNTQLTSKHRQTFLNAHS